MNRLRTLFARKNPVAPPNGYLRYLTPNRKKLLGATSREEQSYCEWFAAERFRGDGCVVEFGPWLGSLTVPTAIGLIRNPSSRNKAIYTYDLFLWEGGYSGWAAGTPYEHLYKTGDSFKPLYEQIVAPFQGAVTIEVHQEDLSKSTWHGQAIEFMINDAWKTIPIMSNTVQRFLPALLPGATVFHQDYLWTSESFIHIGMFRLRKHFEFQQRVKASSTAVFTLVSDLPPDTLSSFAALTGYGDLAEREVDAAFDWSAALFTDPEAQLVVTAGKAWLLHKMGQNDKARRLFATIKTSDHYMHPFYQFQECFMRSWGLGFLID